MARKLTPSQPAPIAVVDAAARVGLAVLLERLPARPLAAALVLRMPEGVITIPVGRVADVLTALATSRDVVHDDALSKVSYRLQRPARRAAPEG